MSKILPNFFGFYVDLLNLRYTWIVFSFSENYLGVPEKNYFQYFLGSVDSGNLPRIRFSDSTLDSSC